MPNILTFIVKQKSNKWTPPKQKAHISYPVQVLGKSCKPVAVMAVCLLLRQKSYALQKYLCVLTIVAGVVVFLYNPKKAGNADGVTIGTGELWILASLTLGKIIKLYYILFNQFQTAVSPHARSTWNATSNRPSRIWCSIWIWFRLSSSPPKASGVGPFSVGFKWCFRFHNINYFNQEFIAFVNRHPSCIQWLAALGLCSAFGQYFIFSIVTTFGPLWCSIVTTTRKFFTIIISVLLLGNALTEQQWTGACLVFVGLSADAYMSSRPKVASNAERKKTQ